MKKNNKFFFYFLLAFSLVNMIAWYYCQPNPKNMLFNSDALYLPTLFSDLFSNNGQLKDWFLTPAPYFFPDYLMFLLPYLIGPTFYSQVLVFMVIQTLLTFFAILLIARVIVKTNQLITASLAVAIFIWLGLNTNEPYSIVFNSAYHYGAFLSSILILSLWVKFKSEDKNNRKIMLLSLASVISYATTLSDNIFLVQLVAPLILTEVLSSIVERDFQLKNKVGLLILFIFSILGSVSYKSIVANKTRYHANIGIENLSSNLKDIYELLYFPIVENPIIGFVFFCYIGIVLYIFIQLVRRRERNTKLTWLVIFSFFSFCTSLLIFLPITNFKIAIRYTIPVFFWPIIVILIFLSQKLRDRFVYFSIPVASVILVSMSWYSYHLIMSNGIKKQYYPADISCIDKVLKKENVRNGIAQYWDAKKLQNLSRLKLNVAQHTDNLDEFNWITSKKYFKKAYDFAIIPLDTKSSKEITIDKLTRINGYPKLSKICGNSLVLIYGKDNLLINKIFGVGGAYTWKACELPTKIGVKTVNCEMKKKSGADSGYLTFGPYVKLSPGIYTFKIVYSSATSKKDTVGGWDVVLALPNEAKVLMNGLIAGTDDAVRTLSGKFSLTYARDSQAIEIRTMSRPNTDLKVIYLRIKRIK